MRLIDAIVSAALVVVCVPVLAAQFLSVGRRYESALATLHAISDIRETVAAAESAAAAGAVEFTFEGKQYVWNYGRR